LFYRHKGERACGRRGLKASREELCSPFVAVEGWLQKWGQAIGVPARQVTPLKMEGGVMQFSR